jgi:Stage II sporulation protein E (SpoIIE)
VLAVGAFPMFAFAKQGATPPGHEQSPAAQTQLPPGQAKKQQAAPTPAAPVQQTALAQTKQADKQQVKAERHAATTTTTTNTATTAQTTTKAAAKSATTKTSNGKGANAQAQTQTSTSPPPGQAKKQQAAAAATPAPSPAPAAAVASTPQVKTKGTIKTVKKHGARKHTTSGASHRATRRAVTRTAAAVTALATSAGGSSNAAPKTTRARKTDQGGWTPAQPAPPHDDQPNVVFRTVRDAVEVIPTAIWILLGLLTGLACLFAVTSARQTRRARRFAAEAGSLMGDVGVLQEAVLPVVPPRVGELALSVAHRPAGGPAAGGDFYDVIPLDGDRTALVVGDVTGHGPGALAQATLVRFTLRAHVESGAGPREALAIATESLAPHFDEGFATAAIAIHDPHSGTLTYATAAHEAPIVIGPGAHHPILVSSSPPLGIGAGPSARRQTIVPFPEQSLACMLTDGALEARVRGELVGRARVEQWVRELGQRPAAGDMAELIRSRAAVSDDLAVCFATSTAGPDSGSWRVEELHRPTPQEAERFLDACGAGDEHKRAAAEALRFSRENAVLSVRFENDAVVSASVARNGDPTPVAA